jgi:hypothetical protein
MNITATHVFILSTVAIWIIFDLYVNAVESVRPQGRGRPIRPSPV